MNKDIHDDVSYNGCAWAKDQEEYRSTDNKVYRDYEWLNWRIKKPVAYALSISEEDILHTNFHGMNDDTDTIRATKFEGIAMPWEFDQQTWLDAREI